MRRIPTAARLIAAAVAGLLAASAPAAQSPDSVAWERFWPIAVGDSMEFLHTYSWTSSGPSGSVHSVVTVAVIADTVLNGEEYLVLDGVANPHRPLVTGRCAVRPIEGGWFSTVLLSGDRCIIGAPAGSGDWVFGVDVPLAPRTIIIGGLPYVVDATRYNGFGFSGNWNNYRFAADVGLTARYIGSQAGSHGSSRDDVLKWARIGRQVFGAHVPTPIDGSPAPADRPELTVRPNPVRGAAAAHLSLPSATAVRLEIWDVLGRLIWSTDLGTQPAGLSEHFLDAARLTPGAYVLRALTEERVVSRTFSRVK